MEQARLSEDEYADRRASIAAEWEKVERVPSFGPSPQSTYLASAQVSPIDANGRAYAFNASLLDPVLGNFWKHGWVNLVDGDTSTALASQPGTSVVKPFAAFCAEAAAAKAG